MQQNSNVGEKAFEYHNSGYHCAEAVSKAIVEAYGTECSNGIPQVATAFGGGVGRTNQELCGALSGGFIAIGYLYGRSEPWADWTVASDLAAKLIQRFERKYATTNCGALLAKFGRQDNMMQCKQLSGEVAAMLADIIEEATL
ncbi:C_GCAxxG_C_C family protein [Olavius algarvensis Delta 1 endosymbiont]|nr:C_GCAxxG_C_C family protein [Olavius algarvensis Delta 1 endosymbiont]